MFEGIDWAAFRPNLVICESFGDELPAVDKCMEPHGYRVLKRLGYNTVFEVSA